MLKYFLLFQTTKYFPHQFEEYLGATEAARQETPGQEHQLDPRIEGEETETVQKWLQNVEYRHDHPELQPGEVVLRLGAGDGHQGEVSRKDDHQEDSQGT